MQYSQHISSQSSFPFGPSFTKLHLQEREKGQVSPTATPPTDRGPARSLHRAFAHCRTVVQGERGVPRRWTRASFSSGQFCVNLLILEVVVDILLHAAQVLCWRCCYKKKCCKAAGKVETSRGNQSSPSACHSALPKLRESVELLQNWQTRPATFPAIARLANA